MRTDRRGSALLAVLWLSAALAAIAFSVATAVRAETERTSTSTDGLRAYYLAQGGIQRAMLYMLWGPGARNPDGTAKYWDANTPVLNFRFASGDVRVDMIPEVSKFDINKINKTDLNRLLSNLGVPPEPAAQLTDAIADWRDPATANGGPFDQYYLSQGPTFRPRHASLEEIEELLLVKGMSPELFYGTFARDAEGRLVRRSGLKDCVSVYGSSNGSVDVNHSEPPVLATVGLSSAAIPALVARRRATPFRSQEQLQEYAPLAGPGFDKLTLGKGTMFTLRATARLRLADGRYSDLSRTVSALVKIRVDENPPKPIEILRWYDN